MGFGFRGGFAVACLPNELGGGRVKIEYSELKTTLLAGAKAAGFDISERQITRWHAADLLPRPVQKAKIGSGGSETFYPEGTTGLLIEIARAQKTVRSFADIGWRIWWRGYPIHQRYWKCRLLAQIEVWDWALQEIFERRRAGQPAELSETFFDSSQALTTYKTDNKFFRHFRKRVGQKNLESALAIIFRLAGGNAEVALRNENDIDANVDIEILEKTLGLKRARKDRLPGKAPWLSGDITPILKTVFDTLSSSSLLETYKNIGDDDLFIARDQLRAVCFVIGSAAQNAETSFGKDAFGLKVAGEFFRTEDEDRQALMLVLFLAIKTNPEISGWVSSFLEILPSPLS